MINTKVLSRRFLHLTGNELRRGGDIRQSQIPMKLRIIIGSICAAAMLVATALQAQPITCSCLATQADLFTNACCGLIPDLCPVATNCYKSSLFPPLGYTCTQSPAPGTPVCVSTPITFTLIENVTSNSVTCTVTFNVGVFTNPFVLHCAPSQNVPCGTTNWVFTPPSVSNICCASLVTNVVLTTNWPTITATWKVSGCGVSNSCTQTITFGTIANPCVCVGIICPSNIVIQSCLGSAAGVGATNVFYPLPVTTNSCPGIITNVVCVPPSGSAFPVGTNTVTCTAYDNLGNSATCTFDIIVLPDTTPPVITCFGNQTNQCGTAWAPIRPTAIDACCGTNVIVSLLTAVTNTISPCTEIITFNWDAMDCNGNHAGCSDLVYVVDTTPPVITCNSNQVVNCSGTVAGGPGWTPVPPTAVDACCTAVTVTLVNMVTNSGTFPCNANLTLTWRATDCCTNSSFCTESVTIIDTNPPIIICGGPRTEECGTGWTFDTPTAFDACCGANVTVTVLSTVVSPSNMCSRVYTRTWQATDCCSNTATCSQVITELDTHPPVMTCATNKTVQCGTAWSFDPPSAIDACCGTNLTIIVLSTVTNSAIACPLVVTQTWQATDCCSNSSTCSQIVTIVDTTPPVITCGPNQTVPCGSTWSFIPPTAVDACCGTNVSIALMNVTTNTLSACQYQLAVAWKAVDCCANASFCTNFVTVVDNIPPVVTCRSNYVVQCGSPIIPPPATDNCCVSPTVTMLSAITNTGGGPCNYTLNVIWQAQDCCTNTATCTEVINIIDTTPPVITCAPNKTVACGNVWSFDSPSATDACCGVNVTIITLSTVTNAGSACPKIITRTWQATDCCTNSATCSQVVTIVDTVPPIITCAPGFTTNFGAPWSFTVPTASDACCGTNVTISVLSTVTNGACPKIITRTWQAADCCNNTAACSQTVTVLGGLAPTNDLCANAVTVFAGTPAYCGTTLCATPSTNIPPPCGASANSPDVWFVYTPICTGPVTINTCGLCPGQSPAFDTVLSAYTGVCTNLTQVACNDDTGGSCGLQSTITFTGTAGVPYYLRVSGFGGASGLFQLNIIGTTVPPPNDQCANAIVVQVGSPAACGTTVCATPSAFGTIPIPCGSSLFSRDVWYKWTPTCTGQAVIDTCGLCPGQTTTFNTVLSVYTGLCGGLTQIACNDNAVGFPPCSPQSRLTFMAYAGITYTIRVAGFGAALAGPFRLNIAQSPTPPSYDLCANAIPLIYNVAMFNNCGANTDGPSQPGCQPGCDVWFRYTAPCSGQVSVATCFANFDTVLSVYSGPCNALNLLACNDNATNGPCIGGPGSFLTFNATGGVTYTIRIGGVGCAQGWGVLQIQGPIPVANTCPPAGGPCFWRAFQVIGTANNTPWSWSINVPCCANVTVTNVPGLPTGSTPNQLAQAFCNSINAVCGANGIQAFPFPPFGQGTFFVCVKSCTPTPTPFNFSVGPAGTPALNQCVIANLGTPWFPLTPLQTSGLCSFNPEIVELPYANADLNHNGVDDAFDIMSGTSADLNFNGIPDEAETCQGPIVTAIPDSQVVQLGADVTLTVSATGTAPLSYQWSLNGLPLAGGTNAALTLHSINSNQLGDYGLTVTNGCGTNEVGPFTLSLQTPEAPVAPYITSMQWDSGTFVLTFATKAGQTYAVDYKDNLSDTAWTQLSTVDGDGQEHTITDRPPLPAARFYRARLVLP
ncbi:MAG: hypothetical protein C5B50_01450 [Verrucomicrobia bacterium]|nr:MAG: hypothetical protein C5B50_01450 [Verrucomicrobiota bacterium]